MNTAARFVTPFALLTSLAIVGCSGADASPQGEQAASELGNQGGSTTVFTANGDFARQECQASGTHSRDACSSTGVAGQGSFEVKVLDALPAITRTSRGEKFRVRVSVKAPGILQGDAPIDLAFETEMQADYWRTFNSSSYEVLGKGFIGYGERTLFPNNAAFDGGRSVGVTMDVMADGTVRTVSVGFTHTRDLDNRTSIILSTASR